MFHHALKGLEKRIVEAHRGSISGKFLEHKKKNSDLRRRLE
jgi:hypothetical protein